MELKKFTEISEALTGMSGGELVKWDSNDEYEFIIIKDMFGNIYEIKAYVKSDDA